MNSVSAICFDLDDTLWDLTRVIPRAEQALYDWYAEYYPNVVRHFSIEGIVRLRASVADQHPELSHDLTALRLMTLRKVAAISGYAPAIADKAFMVFQAQRNRVELYADVLPGLTRLGCDYRLLSLSNGNADLAAIGIAELFEQSFSARELGMAKPATAIFSEVSKRVGLLPENIVHVGDHPENDVAAAQRAGMFAIWVNRSDDEWPLSESEPDLIVGCLEELADALNRQQKPVYD